MRSEKKKKKGKTAKRDTDRRAEETPEIVRGRDGPDLVFSERPAKKRRNGSLFVRIVVTRARTTPRALDDPRNGHSRSDLCQHACVRRTRI